MLCSEPWVCNTSMPPTRMPSPTWIGFAPPRFAVGALAPAVVWASMSWNVIRPALKAVVFTFAMLFPITSI